MSKNKQENPNAFKHWIGTALIDKIATHIKAVDPKFDTKQFRKLCAPLSELELKQRILLISEALYQSSGQRSYTDFSKSLIKLTEAASLKGFELWPITQYVETYGLDSYQQAFKDMRYYTQLFTCEFAIRPYLIRHPDESLKFLLQCSLDKNHHIRRFASEGSRPSLPWGKKTQIFDKTAKATESILENLKYDDELYVRKSVANHLNDLSKMDATYVVNKLKRWQKESPAQHKEKILWICKHSLRSLIKAGDAPALALIGAKPVKQIKLEKFAIKQAQIKMNQHLEFEFTIHNQSKQKQKLVVDYILSLKRANSSHGKKVFKLKNIDLAGSSKITLDKRHHVKPVTIRKYYSGEQFIEIQINGKSFIKKSWQLK